DLAERHAPIEDRGDGARVANDRRGLQPGNAAGGDGILDDTLRCVGLAQRRPDGLDLDELFAVGVLDRAAHPEALLSLAMLLWHAAEVGDKIGAELFGDALAAEVV